MRQLLSQGADPNARNEANRSALAIACLGNSSDAVRLLLEAGADADGRIRLEDGWNDGHSDDDPPLMIAAWREKHEVRHLTACSMES